MDIRIIKQSVSRCEICDDVSKLKNAWDEGQKLLVDNGEQEEPTTFPGIPGYLVKDADDYRFSHNSICDKCMHTLIKGVTLIGNQKLTGISIDSNK